MDQASFDKAGFHSPKDVGPVKNCVIIYNETWKSNAVTLVKVEPEIVSYLREANFAYRFDSIAIKHGYVEVVCADAKSKDWLLQLDINIYNDIYYSRYKMYLPLRCAEKKELLTSTLVYSTDIPFYMSDDDLNMLSNQNYAMAKEHYIKRLKTLNGYKTVFLVNSKMLSYLDSHNWTLYCGARKIKLHKIDEELLLEINYLPCIHFYNNQC